MFISLDWISDYVDLSGISVPEILSRLTLATAETEGYEELKRSVAGVVLGKIVAAEPFRSPEGKMMTFCTVDCGTRTYQTVCGAPNAGIGLIAPFAPAGTTLAGGVVIQKTELAGKPSEGILCSAAELGMSHWHEIVFECPFDSKPGTPFVELVPETDILIEIDNKSLTHRPDLWGHYGFAREFAAVFGRELKPLPLHDLAPYAKLPACELSIEDLENCPAYGCIVLELGGAAIVPSPIKMQRRLHALGQRTYNLLVDLTNYANLELGQPTHAFDGDLVTGIKVAQMGKKSKFRTLDGQDREILPDDLMIWGRCGGEYKPVALAGIMGGQETEVSKNTKKLLLESANFRSGRIRRTASRLDLRTDASQRYEKSQPPANVKTGTERIVRLLEDSGTPFKVLSRFTLEGNLKDEFRTIKIPGERFAKLAGIDIPNERITGILHSIGFHAEFDKKGELTVEIPPFRSEKDVSISEDIIEEVLRVYGYDNIPPVMPEMALCPLHVEKSFKLEHKLRRLLAGSHRFTEVSSYSWVNDNWLGKIGFDPGPSLVLKNPAAQGDARLRTSLLPNMLAIVPKNRAIRDRFRCFELAHVYIPDGKGCIELPRIAGISYRQSGITLEEHYLSIKSAIEDIGAILGGAEFRFATVEESGTPWETAFHSVAIFQGKNKIGSMGVAERSLMDAVSPEGGQLVWFELSLDKIEGEIFPVLKYREPPRFPGSWQDFSLLWRIDSGFAELEASLDGFSHPLIQRREFLIAYKGKGLEKGMASYSFRFWIGAEGHTLEREEIDSFHNSFLEFLKTKEISLRT